MSRSISFVLADSSFKARKETEKLQNEKFLHTVGHTTSRLVDLRLNQLRHGTVLNVDIHR